MIEHSFGMKGIAMISSAERTSESASPTSFGRPSLEPVVAGARARGMADAFELLGVGAIFLDDDGGALHVGEAARALLGPELAIADGRLRARSDDRDHALSLAVDRAVTFGMRSRIEFDATEGEAFTIEILPIPAAEGERFQLLKAVAVLGRAQISPPALQRAQKNHPQRRRNV